MYFKHLREITKRIESIIANAGKKLVKGIKVWKKRKKEGKVKRKDYKWRITRGRKCFIFTY